MRILEAIALCVSTGGTIFAIVTAVRSSREFDKLIKRFETMDRLSRCPDIDELGMKKPRSWLKENSKTAEAEVKDITIRPIPEDIQLLSDKKGIW